MTKMGDYISVEPRFELISVPGYDPCSVSGPWSLLYILHSIFPTLDSGWERNFGIFRVRGNGKF